MKVKDKRLTRNAAKCNKCGDTVESLDGHHFVRCSCKAIAVDGGLEYARFTGEIEDCADLCEYEEYERDEYFWETKIREEEENRLAHDRLTSEGGNI